MKKLNKILLTAMAVPSITTPFVTLTSCSQSWGHAVPFSIGSSEEGPYINFVYYDEPIYDFDKVDMLQYLQTQYSVDQRSGNYAYSTPMKFNDNGEKEGTWDEADSGWYTSSDEVFNSTATDTLSGDDKNVSNARNAALSSNIDFITTIGSSLNAYFNYALQYQAEQIDVNDETNLNIAWGSQSKITLPGSQGELKFQLNHGKKDGTEDEQKINNNFFEYNIARSNLVDDKKSKALFKTSNVDFAFDTAKMPLPSYEVTNDERKGLSQRFIALLEGNNDEAPMYYSSKEEGTETIDDVEYSYVLYKYESVPVFVNPFAITQTYLDASKKSDSFLVNDYYSSTDDILKSAGKQWKDILPKLTNYKEDDARPHARSFTLGTTGGGTQIVLGEKTDARLHGFQGLYLSSFIALMSYNVKIYVDHPEKDVANINKLDNLFPSFFLTLNRDSIFKQLDNDLGENAPYVINQETINEINADFLGLLQRTSKEGRKTNLNDLTQDSKDFLAFLGTMFGHHNDEIIDTSDFLVPNDPIE